jgi:hypothetical protein
VLYNFYGDYQNALLNTAKRSHNSGSVQIEMTDEQKGKIKEQLVAVVNDPKATRIAKEQANHLLSLMYPEKNLNDVFGKYSLKNAKESIVKRAKSYHFLLINEAHYNSQHRVFTSSLLLPLWKEGFRYLALEALGYQDTLSSKTDYPSLKTGYYLRDPAFSSLVADALKIGYKLVPYETQNNVDGTERDSDQAANIYNKTLKNDSVGKVLIHAGYSHIAEDGDGSYRPMGLQLKGITKQDILTVDQVTMIDVLDESKLSDYYQYARDSIKLREPTIFIDKNDKFLVDPVNRTSIDIQVYHPKTQFKLGRPIWLAREGYGFYSLPQAFEKYSGHLLQVSRLASEKSEIPVDQIIIDNKTGLSLRSGDYELRIIDCRGTLKGVSSVTVKYLR